jgi:sugar/nucleoside kinase (ribokinase family)
MWPPPSSAWRCAGCSPLPWALVARPVRALYRVPAHPAHVVDTTGAGDAYCGGFVAGLAPGRPVGECAAMASVAASYVVEACGALATAGPTDTERDARLRAVRAGIAPVAV